MRTTRLTRAAHRDQVRRGVPREAGSRAEIAAPDLAPVATRPAGGLPRRKVSDTCAPAVWHNTEQLQRARLAGPDGYRARLAELEVLSAARIADLLAPGQVLLRLAVTGFGVLLPPDQPVAFPDAVTRHAGFRRRDDLRA